MKREKKAVPVEAPYEDLIVDALHILTYELRSLLTNIVGFTYLLDEATALTDKQRGYVARMVSSTNELLKIIDPMMDSVVNDALEAANREKLFGEQLDRTKLLESISDPQRRARISTALGRHLLPVISHDPELNHERALKTGIAKSVERAWSIRVAALHSELLKHVTPILNLAELLRNKSDKSLDEKQQEYVSYIINSVELFRRIVSEEFFKRTSDPRISNIDALKFENTKEIRAIIDRLRYTESAPSNKEREEGDVTDARRKISPTEALKGLKTFLEGFGVLEEKIDETVLAGVALVAAKAIVEGRPKWNDRKRYAHLRHLVVPGFVREVYRDLIEGDLRLPDGRQIWHLCLQDGLPVWQEAVRSNDAKVVQILQGYINNTPHLGEAKDLIFAKKINRVQPKTRKAKARKHSARKPSLG